MALSHHPERSYAVPITLSTGVTIQTVTFWYPHTHLGITDWRLPLATLFDDEFRPEQRLLAAPRMAHRSRTLLAAPVAGDPTRCAGGPLHLLDLGATGAQAAQDARARHHTWCGTGRVAGRRPGRVESALLDAGAHPYATYHGLRQVVGDALIIMRTGEWLYPVGAAAAALIDHVHQATLRLADAAPHDVLVTVAA
jgi:hypothetical protein